MYGVHIEKLKQHGSLGPQEAGGSLVRVTQSHWEKKKEKKKGDPPLHRSIGRLPVVNAFQTQALP